MKCRSMFAGVDNFPFSHIIKLFNHYFLPTKSINERSSLCEMRCLPRSSVIPQAFFLKFSNESRMKGVTVNDFIVREKNKVSSDYCAKSII